MIGDLFLVVIWRINRMCCSVKSRVVDGDKSVSKLRQWTPTFQVVGLSFLLKGCCPTRLSVCCSTRNSSNDRVGVALLRIVIEMIHEDRKNVTWQSYGTR